MFDYATLADIDAMDFWLRWGDALTNNKSKSQNPPAKTFPELKISVKKFAEKNNIPEDEFLKLQKQARKAVKSLKSIK